MSCNYKGLYFVPKDLHEDIQILQLKGNNIRNLSDASFSRYPLLRSLDLSKNRIRVIKTGTFKPLRLLTTLSLANNPNLYEINDELLRWCSQLVTLNMESTGLIYFPGNTIKWLPNLENLYLQKNNLTSIHFKSCANPRVNTSIDLSYNQISALTLQTVSIYCDFKSVNLIANPILIVDPNSLSDLRIQSFSLGGGSTTMSLETWSNASTGISKSEITSLSIYPLGIDIPRTFFDSFRNHSPPFLYMHAECNYYDIHPFAFNHLLWASSLYVYCAFSITTIKPDSFSGLRQLRTLHIDDRIKSINPSKSLWDNPKMYHLSLAFNMIRKIEPFAFRGLTELYILSLNSNPITVVEITSFSGLNQLRLLDLSKTNIVQLSIDLPQLIILYLAEVTNGFFIFFPGRTFNSTRLLDEMYLQRSNFRIFDLYDDVKKISLFQGLHNLSILNLCGNRLNFLFSDMFADLSSLKHLDLSNSNISVIPIGVFRGLSSLQTLRLKSNRIQRVTFAFFKDLPQLRYIHIEHNDLYYLESHLFRNNPLLLGLYAGNNHLAGFNRSTFEHILSSLVEIDISGNLIVCDCSLKWLIDLLTGPVELKHEQRTICSPVSATLEPLRGKPLMMLASTYLCDPQITTYVFIALPCLTVLVVILLTYWNRWYLRHKLFLLKLAVVGYKEIEDGRNRNEYEYALNVIFTDDCEGWIHQNLRPFLEETFPDMGNVVCGDDDLRLGMHYLDAVLYAVEHSFKTVLLLSRAAVQDHWFMLKFRLAMDYATDMGMENIILIFVEDVFDDEELPYLVRLFLSGSGSYLSWVEDAEGQEYFWKQLEKYLNVNRRINHLLPAQ